MPLDGRLMYVSSVRLPSFVQSISELGGCSSFYSLFEIFQDSDCQNRSKNPSYEENFSEQEDFDQIIQEIENQISTNSIVCIINLIRHTISSISGANLSIELTKNFSIEILGNHLSQLPTHLIDQQLLICIENLMQYSRFIDSSHLFTKKITEHILLNFSIWNKAKIDLRLSHLQFLLKYLTIDRNFDRQRFGVKYFLDVLQDQLK